jgi:hypothetical protein
MCAIKIPEYLILDYKCHKNFFNLLSTRVKYLGIMSSSMVYGISVSYLKGVTFHRVNVQRYLLGKICKRHERIINIAKYFTGEARGRLMYCKCQLSQQVGIYCFV